MPLNELVEQYLGKIESACDGQILEQIRIELFGRNGCLTKILRAIGSLPAGERQHAGEEANRAKGRLESVLKERKEQLGRSRQGPPLDLTLPGRRPGRGGVHPLRQTLAEIVSIFRGLGFEVVDGREIETEFHNFTALNIPLDHPSRDAFDTFYTAQGHLLRSQTSTVQIRVMEARRPPLRILAPGRVYRPDTVDASHSFMFHQIEGLLVDDRTTFGDLKGVLNLFLRKFFGSKTKTRFRPHFFPFTEPSAEVDVTCLLCAGRGCSTCSRSGWLEVLGAGMVDPAVFQHMSYPPGRVQGFAFGMGVERLTMLRHGVHDIRLFFDNNLDFLEQFA